MKLKHSKLVVGQKYFLLDYEGDKVVEGLLCCNDFCNGSVGYDFKCFFDADGNEDYKMIYLKLKDGILKEDVGDGSKDTFVENPIFLDGKEAESKKKKYLLNSLKAVRKLILKELEENTNQIKKIKGN